MSYIFNKELNAMDTVHKALDGLTPTERARVIAWVQEVFEEAELAALDAKTAAVFDAPVGIPAVAAAPAAEAA
jgi:hypothetical protein